MPTSHSAIAQSSRGHSNFRTPRSRIYNELGRGRNAADLQMACACRSRSGRDMDAAPPVLSAFAPPFHPPRERYYRHLLYQSHRRSSQHGHPQHGHLGREGWGICVPLTSWTGKEGGGVRRGFVVSGGFWGTVSMSSSFVRTAADDG